MANINRPLIVVPGLMGSMGNDIIPGTGELGFGPASVVYNRFINMLGTMGYKEEENLFICYYNWRKRCEENVNQYLLPIIHKAKLKTGANKIDIIGHSLGGLVIKEYIVSRRYENDIDKFIMLGTPNAGAVDAYYMWAEGEIPERIKKGSFVMNIIIEGYIHILKKHFKVSSTKELVHKEFKSIKELLPAYGLGPYLFYLDREEMIRYIPYEDLKYKNEFLDRLKISSSRRDVKTFLIAGTGKSTPKSLQLKGIRYDENGRITDWGQIKSQVSSLDGDGTVLLNSSFDSSGEKYIVNTSHIDMLMGCQSILNEILVNDYVEVNANEEEREYMSALVFGKGRLFIKTNHKVQMLRNNIKINNSYFFQNNYMKWVIIEKSKSNEIAIFYKSNRKEKVEVILRDSNDSRIESIIASKKRAYKLIDSRN